MRYGDADYAAMTCRQITAGFDRHGIGIANWLLSFAAGEAGEVCVAIETPRGPVVESLMARGFAVHSINPRQLDRHRARTATT